MATLVSFIYANEVLNQFLNGKDDQIIRNPLLSLRPAYIPGQLSFSIVFGITDIEATKEHTVQYKLTSPEGEKVVDTGKMIIPKAPNSGKKVDGYLGSLDLRNIVFRTKGLYRTELIVDGITLNDNTILVTEADDSGSNATQNQL